MRLTSYAPAPIVSRWRRAQIEKLRGELLVRISHSRDCTDASGFASATCSERSRRRRGRLLQIRSLLRCNELRRDFERPRIHCRPQGESKVSPHEAASVRRHVVAAAVTQGSASPLGKVDPRPDVHVHYNGDDLEDLLPAEALGERVVEALAVASAWSRQRPFSNAKVTLPQGPQRRRRSHQSRHSATRSVPMPWCVDFGLSGRVPPCSARNAPCARLMSFSIYDSGTM